MQLRDGNPSFSVRIQCCLLIAALQPSADQDFTKVTMFDGGAIALRLFYPDSEKTIE
jgi:hypothetical protein